MTDRHQRSLQKILTSLSEAIDVSPAKYRDARERYDTVGSWLGEEDSELAPFKPTIYPQGSFALGTAIRPLGDDEYDVDAVCLLERPPDPITQQVLKRLVGDRLRHPRSRYRQMLEPPTGGRRCWTIRYADASKFHLDVLPRNSGRLSLAPPLGSAAGVGRNRDSADRPQDLGHRSPVATKQS